MAASDVRNPKTSPLTKEEAWQGRQEDYGWGRAFAHLIPFYGIHYAFKRKTITPIVFQIIGSVCVSIFVYSAATPNANEKTLESQVNMLSLLVAPLSAKLGIKKARRFGADQLKLSSIEV
tara:strand:- start:320 stop:679 length:360 start_codon:yes stop_codon:yes gene_type:complete